MSLILVPFKTLLAGIAGIQSLNLLYKLSNTLAWLCFNLTQFSSSQTYLKAATPGPSTPEDRHLLLLLLSVVLLQWRLTAAAAAAMAAAAVA